MSESVCLYCEKPEGRKYKPTKGVCFICSTCVQTFLATDQDYLKWVHDLAGKNSMTDKARAIKMFVVPEGYNESIRPKPKKHGRHTDRKRGSRPAANKKSRIGQIKNKAETAIL